jgi:hypothetical protein
MDYLPRSSPERNKDIKLLGYILLQIGLLKPMVIYDVGSELAADMSQEFSIRKATVNVWEKLGSIYGELVISCIDKWSTHDFDLMDDDNYNVFVRCVGQLELLAKEFAQPGRPVSEVMEG